jgi:asparaginyl-tRNA synthetase
MKTITIKEIYRGTDEFMNQDIEIQGWVRTCRSSKDFGFIEINDGSFFKGIQVVIETNLDNFEELTRTPIGSALKVQGKLIESQGSGQSFEIKADKVEILSEASPEFPLQKKRHSFEFLRTIAHIRPRSNTFSAVFRVRSVLDFAIHSFFQEQNFVYVHTPIITANDCEGAGEMFQVTTMDLNNLPKNDKGEVDQKKDFFGKRAGLTVSGQLNAESYALALRNVYTFGPTFRAENSNTTRHAAEFWMVEPEIAFAELSDDMDLAEKMIKYVINYVREKCPEEMEFFNRFIDKGLNERLDNVTKNNFGRITYTEAIEKLLKADKKFEYKVEWGIDLQTEHERYLVEEVYKKPVFVTDYPKDIKAFYMRMNDDGKTVAAMDLLAPGVGEIIGGSQREERLDILDKRMDEMGVSKEELDWYRDLRKYGGVKHAGFGLGFERLIMYLTGMENIRDVIPFPRTPKSIDF